MDSSTTTSPLVHFAERCFEEHGDTHLGFGWPHAEHVSRRHQMMLEIIREPGTETSLLDFGCGGAHLYESILQKRLSWIHYTGLDLSEKFIELCRQKHPGIDFVNEDLESSNFDTTFDYATCNGLFTLKLEVSHDAFLEYMIQTLSRLWRHCRHGLAFNVMSKCVEWERQDLFHLPMDEAMRHLSNALSRHIVIRHDYGLYEYTVYVYREKFQGTPHPFQSLSRSKNISKGSSK